MKHLKQFIRNILREVYDAKAINPPPHDTFEELEYVINQYYNRYNPEELQHFLDVGMEIVFDKVLLDNGYPSQKGYIKKQKKKNKDIMSHYKNLFKRERPTSFAKQNGVNWKGDDDKMGTADSYSYPSGHTVQAEYIAYVLTEKYPELRDEFFEVANMVAQSRIDRGVHYPSDCEAGKELAYKIFASRKFK